MQRSPLFFWSLFFFLGCCTVLHPHWVYLLPLLVLFYFTKRKGQGLVLFLLGLFFTFHRYPPQEWETAEGQGVFSLISIEPSSSPFQKSYKLTGIFDSFEGEGICLKKIPCVIFQRSIPPKGSKWILEGTLQNKGVFKPKKNIPWETLENSFSLARFRFQCKERVRNLFDQSKSGQFFSALATGDVQDRLLAMEFRKVGLGHILAISGFHFALIALLLGVLFRAVLPPKMAYLVLLFCLTFYFLFLGASPSIMRAYIMIVLALLALLLQKPMDGCNFLGIALLIELLYDPLQVTRVGFQLSFLATLAILLFYPPFLSSMRKLFPKRPLSELQVFSPFNKVGYIATSALRNTLALNLSVHLLTIPATLAIFGVFPLLSLPYNLIFPPFLSLSLLLLPLGILIPPLAFLNKLYTEFFLRLIANPPELLNQKIYTPEFPFSLLVLLLTSLLAFGLTKRASSH